MNERHWEIFCDLLNRILNMGGSWQEKRDIIRDAVSDNDASSAWEEIVGWFPPEEPHPDDLV